MRGRCSAKVGSENTSVSDLDDSNGIGSIMRIDFLAVRQIPLKEHPYIHASDESTSQTGPERPLDADATALFQTVQAIVQKDRDIYDKVCIFLAAASSSNPYPPSEHESICLIRTRILQTRGIIHLPNQRFGSHQCRQSIWSDPAAKNAGAHLSRGVDGTGHRRTLTSFLPAVRAQTEYMIVGCHPLPRQDS